MTKENDNHNFGLVMPFWIDTDAYSARDQLMFCAGYEFNTFYQALKSDDEFKTTIHRENESRFKMAAAKMGRTVTIEQCELEHDPDGTWSYLHLASK